MKIISLVLFLFTVSLKTANAYLNPGTGSMLLQLIVGGALGGLFLLKHYWLHVVRVMRHIFNSNKNSNQDVKPE
jgi:hypothetical protein